MKNKCEQKLDFLYIGAPRAASAWLYRNLEEHPEICVSSKKEDSPFSDSNLSNKYFLENFSNYKDGQIRGGFPVWYLLQKDGALLLKRFFPEIKILVTLRNSIDRAYSQYTHDKSLGVFHKETTFQGAIREKSSIIEYGYYHKLLKPFFDSFDNRQILVLWFEDIKSHPNLVLEQVFEFLNVKKSFKTKYTFTKMNISTKNRLHFRNLHIFMKKILSTGIKINKHKAGRKIINIFKKIKINKLIWLIYKKNIINNKGIYTKKRDGFIISSEDKRYLANLYSKDINNLSLLMNKNLNHWL